MSVAHDPVPAPKPGSAFDAEALLVAASYKMTQDRDRPVLELYCKRRDGLSFVAFYEGFMPYFYALDPPEGLGERLAGDTRVVKVERATLYHERKDHPALKVTLHVPGETPDVRNLVREEGATPFAADIIFTQRFVYDLDLGACIRVRGKVLPRNKDYQTFTQVEAESVESVEPFTLPLSTLSFDIENSIKHDTVLCIGYAFDPGDGSVQKDAIRGREDQILQAFGELVRTLDPDVVTGYNIEGYDIPHLQKRAKALRMPEFTLSREGSEMRVYMNRFLRATGRIITDTWWNVRRELHPKQETLQAVSMLLFDEGKDNVDASRMDEEWKEDPDRVVRYCIRDAELALRIHKHLRVEEKYESLAAVAKLPFDETVNGRTSSLIDSILIRAADREGVAVPMTSREDREKPIEGGYVHAVKPGIYNWVNVLDFKSMYPSVMIANNICFTTLVRDGSGAMKAPNGASYLSPAEREGLLPGILKNLMERRDQLKKRAREAESKDEQRFYNGLQEAVKILMNSFYGVMASAFYRFTDRAIGESITAYARENIKKVIADLEADGFQVIYSDTDSVFFLSTKADKEAALEEGKKVAARFSRGGLSLEYEKLMNPFFTHGAKKRYVGLQVYPREEVVVRGYEVRRTDAFDWQSEALDAVFERLLAQDTEGMLKVAKEYTAKAAAGEVPVSKLVISRTVQKEGGYKFADRMQNVQVMRKLKGMGIDVQPGMKVSWVITGSKGKQEPTPYTGPDSEAAIKPDNEYYARRVAMTLARVTEVFGWGVNDLLSGSRTKNLFESFESEEGSDDETVEASDAVEDPGEAQARAKSNPAPKRTRASTGTPRPNLKKGDSSLDEFYGGKAA